MEQNKSLTQMAKIKMAANLLREIAQKTTDATAFSVSVEKDFVDKRNGCIDIKPDMERRNKVEGIRPRYEGATFYHMNDVVDICRALGLGSWISSTYQRDNDEILFEVHIH